MICTPALCCNESTCWGHYLRIRWNFACTWICVWTYLREHAYCTNIISTQGYAGKNIILLSKAVHGHFCLPPERNLSLSFYNFLCLIRQEQREISLRARNPSNWKTAFKVSICERLKRSWWMLRSSRNSGRERETVLRSKAAGLCFRGFPVSIFNLSVFHAFLLDQFWK